MSYLQPMFDGELAPGIYQLISRAKADSLFGDMTEQGWRGFYIDGDQVTDKASFLQAAATAMEFPGYFGHNWDAFEESLNDLEWAPAKGYVLLYDNLANFADNAEDDWAVAHAIFLAAIERWQAEGVPFYMLIRGTRHHGRELENF